MYKNLKKDIAILTTYFSLGIPGTLAALKYSFDSIMETTTYDPNVNVVMDIIGDGARVTYAALVTSIPLGLLVAGTKKHDDVKEKIARRNEERNKLSPFTISNVEHYRN